MIDFLLKWIMIPWTDEAAEMMLSAWIIFCVPEVMGALILIMLNRNSKQITVAYTIAVYMLYSIALCFFHIYLAVPFLIWLTPRLWRGFKDDMNYQYLAAQHGYYRPKTIFSVGAKLYEELTKEASERSFTREELGEFYIPWQTTLIGCGIAVVAFLLAVLLTKGYILTGGADNYMRWMDMI